AAASPPSRRRPARPARSTTAPPAVLCRWASPARRSGSGTRHTGRGPVRGLASPRPGDTPPRRWRSRPRTGSRGRWGKAAGEGGPPPSHSRTTRPLRYSRATRQSGRGRQPSGAVNSKSTNQTSRYERGLTSNLPPQLAQYRVVRAVDVVVLETQAEE